MTRYKHLTFFFLFSFSFVFGNEYEVALYSRHQGLPQDYVYSLLQDSKHYIWIGTGSGLAKYDGKNFVHFKAKDGLREDFVTASLLLPTGERLFGHFNGEITKVINGEFSSFTTKNITNASINTLFFDSHERLWSGTKEGELIMIDKGRKNLKKWVVAEYESLNFIDSISKHPLLLIATEAHLMLVNTDDISNKPIVFSSNVPDSSGIRNISRLNDNSWIICSQENHLYIARIKEKTIMYEAVSIANKAESDAVYVKSLGKNKFWMASASGQWKEFKYSEGKIIQISTVTDASLTATVVPNALFEDNEGNIWLGTFGNGLFKFSLKRSSFYDLGQKNDSKVLTMNYATGHGILMGTTNGLFASTDGIKRFERIENKHVRQGVVSICQFDQDVFLVATTDSKVFFWNKALVSWNEWNLPTNAQDKVRQIVKDKEGNIWVATSSGAIKYDVLKRKFKILTMEDGLAHNYVYCIFPDSKGKIWFGTHKSGLSYYKGRKIVTVKSPLENTGLDVNCFTEDNDGRVWVGTSGQGIFVVDEKDNYVNYVSTKEGLVSDYVYFFQKDQSGAVWVGHKSGLSKVIASVKNGFFISDYSQYLSENELSQSFYSMVNGNEIWLGGIGKVIRLNIDSENKSPEGSYVDISDLKLNYEHVNWKEFGNVEYTNEIPDHLKFSHNENLLTFSFNGISFSYNDKLRYQYKLEGFDENWSLLTEQNFVTYNKLPPGRYTFLVKSRNYAGIWSANPTELHFEILPPYWETWWFRIMAVLIIIAVVYTIIKIRTSALKKRNEALEIEKAKLEKEIQERKRIESKLLRSELSLKNTNQELNTLIYRASHDLRGPVSTISGLVNVAKLRIVENESLSFFGMINTSVEKLDMILKKLFLVSEIKQNEIQLEVFNLRTSVLDVLNTFADSIRSREFAVEVEDHFARDFYGDKKLFETIVRNLVDNSLMYNRKTGCQLVITLDESMGDLVLKVWDNGKGIKSELIDKVFDMFYKASDLSKGNGLGLYIVKNAVQIMNGDVFIKSKENEYTLVEVHIPEIKKKQ